MASRGIYGGAPALQSAPVKSNTAANQAYGGGTSSYPVTGFPASAYLGNNRKQGSGTQSSASAVSSALGNIQQLNNVHVVIVLAALVGIGYLFWHLDNRR